MGLHTGHEMLAKANHDEVAQQDFVASLKRYLFHPIETGNKRIVDKVVVPGIEKKQGRPPKDYREVRKRMETLSVHQTWKSMLRNAQEMMWEYVGQSLDRQLPEMIEKAKIENPKGSLTLDPDLRIPRYVSALDIHCMPGNYHTNTREDDIRAGALLDRAAAVYHMGRIGGLNDARGRTLVQHLYDRFGDIKPRKILQMGCAAGVSTVPLAQYFPDAEVHAIDVGAPMLRYAHARAEHLGAAVHFSQQNAEHTNFDDDSFDVVVSSVMLHETSHKALPKIIEECFRLLKPGGIMAHLEVPSRFEDMDTWQRIRADFETYCNNEPFWHGISKADMGKISRQAGFEDVREAYQAVPEKAQLGKPTIADKYDPKIWRWYLLSGRKPV